MSSFLSLLVAESPQLDLLHSSVDAKNITSSYLETMLFMGRKYEIASFTTSAKNILRQLFPSTLELWDRCQPDLTRLTVRNYGFLFDVFNMVCEYPIPSIMQPLLISLCTTHSLVRFLFVSTFILSLDGRDEA